MSEETIKIGGAYKHSLHGNCVVLLRNRGGYWIQVWGGASGDKLYTIKGVDAKYLSPRLVPCRECLEEFDVLPDGVCDDCRTD